MAFKPIQIVINAKDNASAVFGRLEGKVKMLGVAIAGYFGIRAFAGGVQGAADFEAAMSRVKAATDGTAEEMQALTKAAQDAGANTQYTSVQSAGALENLAKAGLSASDSIKALPAVLALAQAGDVELGAASEYVTKAVMGMGLAFDDAARVADVLALGANATNTSVEGLAQALSYAAPVATSLGVSLESTVAILGKLADAGIDASRSGTALNGIMSQFQDPASKFREELGAAGIVTNNFEQALRELAAKGPAGARAINAVGLNAGPALRALLNQGMGALDELTGKLQNAEGSAAAAAKTMQDNFSGSLLGLKSVWQAVVETLNTPVLPVLRKGVDELVQSLRNALADGTVDKFGQILAAAFEAGIKGFKEFAATFDVNGIILRSQVMASEVGESFRRIATFAKQAGYGVQTAWGLMSAGVSGVMTVVYGLGGAVTAVFSGIQHGLALLYEGMSKITFGEISEKYARAAAEVKLSAEATWAAANALVDKSNAAIGSMAEGAQQTRDAWAGLTAEVGETQEAVAPAAQTLQALADAVQDVAAQSAAAVPAMQAKADADKQAAESVNQLRSEYQTLVQSGNLQAAATKLQEIDRIQRQLSGSAQDVADKTALIDQAYASLGLKTNTELQRLADQAREAFERLSQDGTQPPQRIAEAWKVMADRVIEANAGVAPSWLKTEAAVKGYEMTIDRAGKAVVSTERATLKATQRMAGGFDALASAASKAKDAAQQANNPRGAGPRNAPDAPAPSRSTGAKTSSASDRNADRDAERERGNQERRTQAAQRNTGGSSRDLLQELFGQGGMQSVFPKGAITFQMPAAPMALGQPGGVAPVAAPTAPTASVMTQRHEIVLNGRDLGAIATDAEGGATLDRFLQELERGAITAGGMH